MDKAQQIEHFLGKTNADTLDKYAQTAIKAIRALSRLATIADDRGDYNAFLAVDHARQSAVCAFACAHATKDYGFAEAVAPGIAELTAQIASQSISGEDAAPHLLAHALAIVDHYQDVLYPVTAIRGITSVAILRGDKCKLLLAEMSAHNDN